MDTNIANVAAPVRNCFGIPDTHNGWTITQGPDDRFYANMDHSADTWEELEDVLNGLAQFSAPQGEEERLREALILISEQKPERELSDDYNRGWSDARYAARKIALAALAPAAIASGREGAE